jgi:hypothetical protein
MLTSLRATLLAAHPCHNTAPHARALALVVVDPRERRRPQSRIATPCFCTSTLESRRRSPRTCARAGGPLPLGHHLGPAPRRARRCRSGHGPCALVGAHLEHAPAMVGTRSSLRQEAAMAGWTRKAAPRTHVRSTTSTAPPCHATPAMVPHQGTSPPLTPQPRTALFAPPKRGACHGTARRLARRGVGSGADAVSSAPTNLEEEVARRARARCGGSKGGGLVPNVPATVVATRSRRRIARERWRSWQLWGRSRHDGRGST